MLGKIQPRMQVLQKIQAQLLEQIPISLEKKPMEICRHLLKKCKFKMLALASRWGADQARTGFSMRNYIIQASLTGSRPWFLRVRPICLDAGAFVWKI